MSTQASELVVRRHDRYVCDLPAQIEVAPASAAAVRLSQSAVGANGRIAARVSDCSSGGLGLRSPVFLPLTALLVVTVTMPDATGGTLTATLRIQRATMTDRKPTFYIGGSFEGLKEPQVAGVAALLAALKASGAQLMPEPPRA